MQSGEAQIEHDFRGNEDDTKQAKGGPGKKG
jgi:hypothetical protein